MTSTTTHRLAPVPGDAVIFETETGVLLAGTVERTTHLFNGGTMLRIGVVRPNGFHEHHSVNAAHIRSADSRVRPAGSEVGAEVGISGADRAEPELDSWRRAPAPRAQRKGKGLCIWCGLDAKLNGNLLCKPCDAQRRNRHRGRCG